MHWRTIMRLFGILLMLYSLSFLPSIGVSLYYADGQWPIFLASTLIAIAAGGALWYANRRSMAELSIRDGFLVTTLFWAILGVVGALPFLLGLHLDFTDAIFESISGFTTTGATVITGLDDLPRSVLYHRQQIQWLGGMGIIVLAIAILPLLGVGGMQLYRAEASGVAKHEKMTPRIAQTARVLWAIYLALTVACGLGYWLVGMQPFEAVSHALTTVATGGFSTHDASIGFYDSPGIEAVATVFMLAGGVNFAIHFLAWRRRSLREYVNDPEVTWYVLIFAGTSLFVGISLVIFGSYPDAVSDFRHAGFQVASVITSTGFATTGFTEWPRHVPLTLILLSFVGGCAGSTAGGIKVLRIMLLVKLGIRQLFLLAHPNAVSVVKLRNRPVSDDVQFSVWGFYVLYIVVSLLMTIAFMAAGLDLESAFGAVAASINLLGPGLGEVANNFASVSDTVKWLGLIGMLIGRLEVFTLLILFMPTFWRR